LIRELTTSRSLTVKSDQASQNLVVDRIRVFLPICSTQILKLRAEPRPNRPGVGLRDWYAIGIADLLGKAVSA
jgi:hypothetical protein